MYIIYSAFAGVLRRSFDRRGGVGNYTLTNFVQHSKVTVLASSAPSKIPVYDEHSSSVQLAY